MTAEVASAAVDRPLAERPIELVAGLERQTRVEEIAALVARTA